TEFLIHARESHVRDLIDGAEPVHDAFADGARRDLLVVLRFEEVHDVFDEHRDLLGVDGALVAGGADGADEFLAIEVLAATIAFQDDEAITDERFGGGEAMAALHAFPAAADGRAILADA